MTAPELLGQLSGLQEMMRELPRALPASAVSERPTPELACLGWYLGRSVYRETYWLREVIAADADLADRLRGLFAPGPLDLDERCARLPPPSHLLAWAAEIHDEHLRRLATPGALPPHPLLAEDRLPRLLLQEAARDYESMLAVVLAHRLKVPSADYRVDEPLPAVPPQPDATEVAQGRYEVGSLPGPFAYDNELPPHTVELASFRIARQPVSNAQYLAFMEGDGYRREDLWSDEGRLWLAASGVEAPVHWRRDPEGHWYAMGLNGPGDLSPGDPVCGVGHHEAAAFAAWAASLGEGLQGAVLQHEYQWEVAARCEAIEDTGRVWEWCANPFHPYPGFTPFPDAFFSIADFEAGRISLRGASLHSHRCLRRASFRNRAAPGDRHVFAGLRLVLPPA